MLRALHFCIISCRPKGIACSTVSPAAQTCTEGLKVWTAEMSPESGRGNIAGAERERQRRSQGESKRVFFWEKTKQNNNKTKPKENQITGHEVDTSQSFWSVWQISWYVLLLGAAVTSYGCRQCCSHPKVEAPGTDPMPPLPPPNSHPRRCSFWRCFPLSQELISLPSAEGWPGACCSGRCAASSCIPPTSIPGTRHDQAATRLFAIPSVREAVCCSSSHCVAFSPLPTGRRQVGCSVVQTAL